MTDGPTFDLETAARVRLHTSTFREGSFGRLILDRAVRCEEVRIQARAAGGMVHAEVCGIGDAEAIALAWQIERDLSALASATQAAEACSRERVVHLTSPYVEHREIRAGLRAENGPFSDLFGTAQLAGFAWLRTMDSKIEPPPVASRGAFPAEAAFLAAALTPLVPGSADMLQSLSTRHAGRRAHVEWWAEARGTCMDVWLNLPRERTQRFLEVLIDASVSIQRALRNWLPAIWLSAPDAFEPSRDARAALLYSGIPVRRTRNRCCYTYDPMDARQITDAIAAGRRELPARFGVWAGALRSMDHARCEEFEPDHPYEWHYIAAKAGARLKALLAAEGTVMDQLVSLAGFLRTLDAEQHPRRLGRLVRDCVGPIETRLRRVGHLLPCPELAHLLFVYATAAVARSVGWEPAFRLTFRIRVEGEEMSYLEGAGD